MKARLIATTLALSAGLALDATEVAGKEPARLYGLLERAGRDDLVRLDPNELRPGVDRLDIGEVGHAWAFAPDRTRLALGGSYRAPGTTRRTALLRIVDLDRWQSERVVWLGGGRGDVRAASWVGDRILALVAYAAGWVAITVDPSSGRVEGRRALAGNVLHAVPTVHGLTLLTAPREVIGSPATVRLDPSLRIRSVTLERLKAGFAAPEGVAGTRRSQVPGFAVRGGALQAVAYVLGAGDAPAVVDLRRMRVGYPSTRLLAAGAKSQDGTSRFAAWTGRALVYGGLDHATGAAPRPAGVWLHEPRSWQPRLIDPQATSAVTGGGFIVTWGATPVTARGRGISIFGATGRQNGLSCEASASSDWSSSAREHSSARRACARSAWCSTCAPERS